jgi:hypothetical protein
VSFRLSLERRYIYALKILAIDIPIGSVKMQGKLNELKIGGIALGMERPV